MTGGSAEFGHTAINGPGFHMDIWGKGPLLIRHKGRKWLFEFSEMFGPSLLRRDGWTVSDRQPLTETHPFWAAFEAWRKGGMRHRAVKDKRGKLRLYVCHVPMGDA